MNAKKGLFLIVLTILIDSIGFGIVIPILPKLLTSLGVENYSDGSGMAAWLIFAYALSQFLFSPLLGALSDKFGRKPILVISLLGLGLDYIFHAFANTIPLLFVGRIIAGICGASFTTASAYIADITEPEKRGQNFGLIGVAFGIGFILGPVIGAFTASWGITAPFFVAAGLSLLNCLLCIFILPESLPVGNRRKVELKKASPWRVVSNFKIFPNILVWIFPMFLVYMASHAVQSNWSFYTMYKFHWTEKTVGISLAAVGIAVAVVQGGIIRYAIPKLGVKKCIIYGFALYILGMIFFALSTETWQLFASIAVYCLGGISGPAIQQIMSNQVEMQRQGELNGIITSTMSITAILGPLLMNFSFKYFTESIREYKIPEAPMYLGCILILVGLGFAFRALRKAQIR